ncbi:MAG: DUF58 domain-containing protein [Pirellulaceae bacterium]|nr:DUF58 domain-containing protein [Pirellulaceae bacterium]
MTPLFDFLQTIQTTLRSNPVLLLLLISAPLAALAFFRRLFPSLFAVLLLMVPCFCTLGLLLKQDAFLFVLTIDLVFVVVAMIDLMLLPRVSDLSVTRSCQRVASLEQKHPVSITITNRSQSSYAIKVKDDVPEGFNAAPEQLDVIVGPSSRTTVSYEMRAVGRGAFQLQSVYLMLRSRLGLWQKPINFNIESTIHVYPDMKQLSEYALLARTNRLSLLGVRRTRRIGQDNEFERLRDYTHDDNYKHIDWRSTARRNKLTVKDFQTNQSQRVIFLLDCGRMMTNQAGGLSLLDHSLNAMLMMSYVALERGDTVGLLTFSDQIHSFVPPRGGRSQMNHLLHASFDRFPTLVESRYKEAFLYLSARCRKRSLVVLITNLIDDVNAAQVYDYLSAISKQHLSLAVVLRDHQLFDAVDISNSDHSRMQGSALYRSAAAAEILTWRQQVLTDLEHQGVLVLDAFPSTMTAPLINQYLEIKARHLL